MKKLKSCLLVLLLLLVSVAAASYYLFDTVINRVIVGGLNTVGPEVTGTTVSLKKSHVILFNGTAHLTEFVVGSPKGFNAEHTFLVGSIHAAIAPLSVFKNTVIIKEIIIDDVEVTWEGSLRGSNLSRIQENINTFIGESKTAEEKDAAPVRVVIKRLLITNVRVRVSTGLLRGKGLVHKISDIELTDLGTESGGLTTAEALARVSPIVFKEIGKVVATIGVGTAFGGPVGGVIALPVTEGVKTGINKVKQGVGGLFRMLRRDSGTPEEEK